MQVNDILKFFAAYIEKELGIQYSDANFFQLQNRLEDIAKLNGCGDLEALYKLAAGGIHGAFKQMLLDVATNNETSFFRDPRVFRALENTIFKTLTAERPGRILKIWSAASSTGQEALSMAIILKEMNSGLGSISQFSITATDISERVLSIAKAGSYSQLEVQRGMPAPLLLKYFTKEPNDRWSVSRELLNRISYGKQNLKDPFTFGESFDLIMCRNVLIYQNVAGKKEIMNRLTETLNAGGILILGSGESLVGLSDSYEQVNMDGAIVYRKVA